MVIGDLDESAAPVPPPRKEEKVVTAFCRSAPPDDEDALFEPLEPLEPVEPEFELLLLPHAASARAAAAHADAPRTRRLALLVINSPLRVTGPPVHSRRGRRPSGPQGVILKHKLHPMQVSFAYRR